MNTQQFEIARQAVTIIRAALLDTPPGPRIVEASVQSGAQARACISLVAHLMSRDLEPAELITELDRLDEVLTDVCGPWSVLMCSASARLNARKRPVTWPAVSFSTTTGLLLILTTKLVLSLIYQPSRDSIINGTKVAVIIAVYNEAPIKHSAICVGTESAA